jgi:hypothetical protein
MKATVDAKQVVVFAHVPRSTLSLWAADGTIKPVVRGGKGRGHSDRFSFAQALGIVLAQALRETIGCNVEQLRAFAAMSDADFQEQYRAWKAGNVERDFNGIGWSDEEEDAMAHHRLALFNVSCQAFGRLAAERSDELFAFYHARQSAEVAERIKARRLHKAKT